MPISWIAQSVAIVVLLWTFAGAPPETYGQSGGIPALESAEASLELSRSERRRIQMGLAAEGFDPGPADGLFGRGTREAIRKWQERRGEAATGYLNADAARALLAAAKQRSGSAERGVTDPSKEILRDKLILGLSRALKADDHPKALEFIDKLEKLGDDLPPAVDYFRGEAYIHTGRYDEAQRALNRYVEKTGRKGRYYQESLKLMLVAEEEIAAQEKMLNERDEYGNTLLHRAAWSRRDSEASMKMATKLIVLGIDVNAKNMYGRTPLHFASDKGKYKMVDLLIERGAVVDAKDNGGKTPLHEAATYPAGGAYFKRHADRVTAILIKAGADVDAKDEDGETPLFKVTKAYDGCGCYEVARLLIKAGANVNASNKSGRTPLDAALTTANSAMQSILRNAGARD